MSSLNKEKFNHIVCAVRGGTQSRQTVTYAIKTALETNSRLTFFHVMNAEFMQHATIGPLSVIYQELVEMGNFAMMILCDRARRRGVDEVDFVIQEGNIKNRLRLYALESNVDLLIVGSPSQGSRNCVFKPNELESLLFESVDQLKTQIKIVPPSDEAAFPGSPDS